MQFKEIIGLGREKHSHYLTGLGLTYDVLDLNLKKHSDYLAGLGLTL